jgi:hypothetical protein
MKKLLLGSAALAVLAATARQPGRGSQTTRSAPEWIITFAAGGGVSTNPSYPTDPGPYDGSDDTYIGAINNSNSAISSFRFGGPASSSPASPATASTRPTISTYLTTPRIHQATAVRTRQPA